MTDQEILEKYRETIANGVDRLCKENHVEDEDLKEAVLHAYQEGFLKGFKEGVEKGKQKLQEEKKKMARMMLQEGDSIQRVCKITGLSENEVKSI